MDDLLPENLIARDGCVHMAGLLGRRGQLDLYADRLVFQGSGDSRGRGLPIERVTHIRLRGYRRRVLEVGLGSEEAAFKFDQAADRFRDLCALLVRLNPPLPWLDARFGTVDQAAAAAMLAPHGLELAVGERLELCDWSLAWEEEELVRCGWLLLASHRLIFLFAGDTPKRAPLALRLVQLQRLDQGNDAESHLHLGAQRTRLHFEPHSGSEFTRAFWARCHEVVRPVDDEAVRDGQALQQLTGSTGLSRLQLGDGANLSLRDLTWRVEGKQLRALARFRDVQQLQPATRCAVELIKRGGLFVFEGRIEAVSPVKDGPFKPSDAWLDLAPTSDIQFVNRRRAFRVEIAKSLHVMVAYPDPEGGWEEPISTVFRLADLSNIGCALVGPAEIPLDARFVFELTLGPEERRLSLVAECIYTRPIHGPPGMRHYGLQLLGLTDLERDAIQAEVVHQERLQLRRRAMVK